VGADVKIKNDAGWTALHSAGSSAGSAAFIHPLVNAGADKDAQDSAGRTPLMQAVFYNLFENTKVMIGLGVQMNLRDREGKSALDLARNEAMKKILTDAGAQ
jgi:ankyrin repeat protein